MLEESIRFHPPLPVSLFFPPIPWAAARYTEESIDSGEWGLETDRNWILVCRVLFDYERRPFFRGSRGGVATGTPRRQLSSTRGCGVTADKAAEEENVKAKSREGSALFCAGKIKCKWGGWFSPDSREERRRRWFRWAASSKWYSSNDSIIRGNEWTLTEIACTRIDRGIIERGKCIDSRVFNLCFVLFWCWMRKKRKKFVLTFIAK